MNYLKDCFYYRQSRIREIVGNEIPEFVEVHQPDFPTVENTESITTVAIIRSGKVQIALSNSASEVYSSSADHLFENESFLRNIQTVMILANGVQLLWTINNIRIYKI